MSWSCDVTPADCSPVFGYKVSQSLQSYSAGLFSSAETSANRTFTSGPTDLLHRHRSFACRVTAVSIGRSSHSCIDYID